MGQLHRGYVAYSHFAGVLEGHLVCHGAPDPPILQILLCGGAGGTPGGSRRPRPSYVAYSHLWRCWRDNWWLMAPKTHHLTGFFFLSTPPLHNQILPFFGLSPKVHRCERPCLCLKPLREIYPRHLGWSLGRPPSPFCWLLCPDGLVEISPSIFDILFITSLCTLFFIFLCAPRFLVYCWLSLPYSNLLLYFWKTKN